MKPDPASLYLKNSAVGLVIIIPLLLLFLAAMGTGRKAPEPDPPLPMIVLKEAEGLYKFPTGSATLSAEFDKTLRTTIADTLAFLAARHRADLVEVIGHTDGQQVRGRSNLDSLLLGTIRGDTATLMAGSNADLGLMRAWAVARVLQATPQLSNLRVVGYSAGHTMDTTGMLTLPVDFSSQPSRRRIEIWVRRSR